MYDTAPVKEKIPNTRNRNTCASRPSITVHEKSMSISME
jgi:hypothetical protein